jgi:hypothetical protein
VSHFLPPQLLVAAASHAIPLPPLVPVAPVLLELPHATTTAVVMTRADPVRRISRSIAP